MYLTLSSFYRYIQLKKVVKFIKKLVPDYNK